MSDPLRIGLKHHGQDCSLEDLRATWRLAEEAGFDHVWTNDHLATIEPFGPNRTVFDGWTLLAAMAEATTRVRLGILVTGNTYRHPGLLAKIATTVDHLSGGRVEFGIGAGWSEIEHRMYGIEGLPTRVGRLSEALSIIRSLWTEECTTFHGRHYHLEDAIANPKPVQRPHPPIWMGAGGPRMLALAARHADVWNPAGPALDDLGQALEAAARLEKECEAVGRDPRAIRRCAQIRWTGDDPNVMLERAVRHVENGFSEIILMVMSPNGLAKAHTVAERVLPELSRLS